MHGMHARLPKNFVLEERLERYGRVIELTPERWRGRWAEAAAPVGAAPYCEVRLDLGCGKGSFAIESAKQAPDVLFVAMDAEPVCVAYAAQHVCEAGVPNVVVVPGNGLRIREFFAPDELSRIHLNFPTPFPRKREAHLRMARMERLMDFREVLKPDGEVILKTDSQPLFSFMLGQVPMAGYELLWETNDARTAFPDAPTSEYEEKLGAQGARVFGLACAPGPAPAVPPVQTAELSLACYLPRDLSVFDGYAPHGMEATVTNLRNREAKCGSWESGITR